MHAHSLENCIYKMCGVDMLLVFYHATWNSWVCASHAEIQVFDNNYNCGLHVWKQKEVKTSGF